MSGTRPSALHAFSHYLVGEKMEVGVAMQFVQISTASEPQSWD